MLRELNLSVRQLAWCLDYSKNIMHVAELETKARFSDYQAFPHCLPWGYGDGGGEFGIGG